MGYSTRDVFSWTFLLWGSLEAYSCFCQSPGLIMYPQTGQAACPLFCWCPCHPGPSAGRCLDAISSEPLAVSPVDPASSTVALSLSLPRGLGCTITSPCLRWYLLGQLSLCDLLTLLLQPRAWTCTSGHALTQPITTRRSPHPWSTGHGRPWSLALSTCCWACCTFSWRVSATLTCVC